jgi:hypothetical protein
MLDGFGLFLLETDRISLNDKDVFVEGMNKQLTVRIFSLMGLLMFDRAFLTI